MFKKFLLSLIAPLFALTALLFVGKALALTPEQAFEIAGGDSDARIAAMQKAVQSPDERLAVLLQA